jgi:DNA-binding transcriptional ArsR family regulator
MVNSSAQLDRSFLALSHPVRRAIVARLARGPATVGEAAQGVAVSKPAITKHVKVLEEAGVIRRAVQGRNHRLELDPRALNDASRWIERHQALWETKFDTVERYLAETEQERRSS